jgi:hypothetical protein
VKRLVRLIVLAAAAAVLVPASAGAALRMFVGFQDDASFRFRPDRHEILDEAKQANATIVHTTISWAKAAPTRPANASNPFDPAYRLEDIDEFVRQAQARGIEPMIQVYGTADWANNGAGVNRMPTRLADFTTFCRAVAARYSGRYPGFPFVRFWSIWNEPNLNQFFSPQFDSQGRDVAPRNYARLFAAGYAGIKAGNGAALVGMGETSMRGRDVKRKGLQDTHSPARFIQLVAKANPHLRFDALAHHPYPTDPKQRPEQIVRYPNVSLKLIPRFDRDVNKWFHRRSTPFWITEYGHETSPPIARGTSYALQAAYARRALLIARGYPYVSMFIWFVLHDDQGDPFKSGLIAQNGTRKPAFFTFAATARLLDAHNPIVTVKPGTTPVVRVAALELAYRSGPGGVVGSNVRVFSRGKLVAVSQPQSRLGIDGYYALPVPIRPAAGRTYTVSVDANDAHGNRIARTLTLVAPAPRHR